MKHRRKLSLLLITAVLSIPLLVTHAAGGRLEGKVTDPKGAAIPGATVSVTNEATNQEFTGITDALIPLARDTSLLSSTVNDSTSWSSCSSRLVFRGLCLRKWRC